VPIASTYFEANDYFYIFKGIFKRFEHFLIFKNKLKSKPLENRLHFNIE